MPEMDIKKALTNCLLCAYVKIQGGSMKKTKQLLTYLVQKHPFPSITSLWVMKLSYIVDLVSVKKNGKPISNFEYVRYKYGPFDNKIYKYLNDLLETEIISEESVITQTGEVIVYKFNEGIGFSFDKLTSNEKETIDEVIDTLSGYGPKALVDLTYKTTPMERIGAKQDNDVGLYEKLDLKAT